MTGRIIQQYEIKEKLGSGGMGHVYKARDTRLNRFVAIKALALGKMADDDLRDRFWQEAQSASALNHPNIITIHDILSQDGSDFLVMEYLTGRTLAEIIPAGGLAPHRALDYGVQTASALAAAHKAGIVHRDLKPGNIMISESGHVKLVDFGLAKQLDSGESAGRAALTIEGAIMGTAAYMSPEQAEGRKVDARSDVFSFGAILHEMLTGRRAFPGESQLSILGAVLRDEPRPVTELVTDLPAGIEAILTRCLRKDPAMRWQNTEELHSALASIKAKLDASSLPQSIRPEPRPVMAAAVPPPPPPPPSPPVEAKQNPNLPLLAVAALVIAAAAGVIGWKTRPRPEPRVDPIMIPPVSRDSERPSAVAPLPAPAATPAPAPPSPDPAPVPRPPAVAGGQPKPAVKSVVLADGYPVPLLLETVLTKDMRAGAPVRFTVSADIAIDGHLLIARSAPAAGSVREGKKKFLRGRGLAVGFQEVRAVDGKPVRLRAALAPGKDDTVAVGKENSFIAYVDGDIAITPQR